LTHWLLFIHKILFSSTCFEPQVLVFRRIQLYTCSIWYCHSVNRFCSDRASWIVYILITNLMHWLLFIHKILFFSTCFEAQVLIFMRIHLCTCSIWYCHSVNRFFSDRVSWIDSILITNLMHWLLFIHKILFFSTCFEAQVLIFRRIHLCTCSIWYCHSVNRWVVEYY